MGPSRRKQPFPLLIGIAAFVLLILACLTNQNSCYDQLGSSYADIDSTLSDYCALQCSGDFASKKIAFINGLQTAALPGEVFDGTTPIDGLQRVIRCSWARPTRYLFLADAFLLLIWASLKIFMPTDRRSKFVIKQVLFWFGVVLTLSTVIYQNKDIARSTCSNISFPTPASLTGAPAKETLCDQSLYKGSFVCTMVTVGLVFCQAMHDAFKREAWIHEKDPQYAGIPQRTSPRTHKNIALSSAPFKNQ